ncbi:MAG: nucleotide exchange factor GrpE [Candidatus Helarchaeota archaeon]|nr:nucleotide exchange factor GrpE [Candidatus Helarchaeota archaeon]
MKEEKSPNVTEKNEINTKSTEVEEVDVGFDDDEVELVVSDLDDTSENEVERSIPEEWKGKSEKEIALLFEIQDLKNKLETSEKEWFEKYARLQAEFDNFRKRSLKEKDDYIKFASSQLILKLLPILDSAELMLKNLEQELEPNEFKGIQMLFQELFGVLEKEGLTPIKAKGEKFDPFVHEILTIEYTDEYPEETIIEVFQRGYRFQDRILRPSKVKISKIKKEEEKKLDSEREE